MVGNCPKNTALTAATSKVSCRKIQENLIPILRRTSGFIGWSHTTKDDHIVTVICSVAIPRACMRSMRFPATDVVSLDPRLCRWPREGHLRRVTVRSLLSKLASAWLTTSIGSSRPNSGWLRFEQVLLHVSFLRRSVACVPDRS